MNVNRKKVRVFHKSSATSFGPVAIVWSHQAGGIEVRQVVLPAPAVSIEGKIAQSYPHSEQASAKNIDRLLERIVACIGGEDVKFSLDEVALDLCSPFQRSVLEADYAIPRGSVSTYGLIAGYIGKPRGARAVGRALATNPFPIIIPCHRAIRGDGTIGGFGGGTDMKRALLLAEGVTFDERGRIQAPECFYYGAR